MNQLWQVDINDYMEIVRRCRVAGLKAGDDMTPFFLEYMAEKNQKPIGVTEQDIDLLTGNLRENGIKVLNLKEKRNGI